MPGRTYPASPASAALRLFLRWFGGHYARSTAVSATDEAPGVLRATVEVGRRWRLAVTVLDTLAAESDDAFAAARALIEERLDMEGRSLALWLPRGGRLPTEEPALSELLTDIRGATPAGDERLEVRRPVRMRLRRGATTGSVVTVLGGLSGHWAQFTNRVAGSFQLNSSELLRLPASQEERDELAERVVLAAQQPDVDDGVFIAATDAWTANDLEEGGSAVIGSPKREGDETSAALRRELRALLRSASAGEAAQGPRALVLLGAATYAEEEKLSWALRGMDPSLYAGYELITVVADGVVKRILEPPRSTLPWDAPLG